MTTERLVLDANEVAQMFGLSASHVRNVAKDQGHFAGVPKLTDVGKRVLFSKARMEAALGATAEQATA